MKSNSLSDAIKDREAAGHAAAWAHIRQSNIRAHEKAYVNATAEQIKAETIAKKAQ